MQPVLRNLICLGLLLVITACAAPRFQGKGDVMTTPRLTSDQFQAADGTVLRVRRWPSLEQPARAVMVGVHGFNDYGNFLMPDMPAFLQAQGIELITYDQRGFGTSKTRGHWAGNDVYRDDLATFIELVKADYPDQDLYVFAESMGGAIALTTLAEKQDLPVAGLILSAPAVWGRATWPWYQKLALSIAARIAPRMTLSGGGIVQPTDNIDVWQNWSLDPLVIKKTRVSSLWGVSAMMDEAFAQGANFTGYETLVLYGAQDEVIPLKPVQKFMETFPEQHRFAFYSEGWHLLPRDHNGPQVWADVMAWIADPKTPLPSGADVEARARLLHH